MTNIFAITLFTLICVNYTFTSFIKNDFKVSLETVKVCADNDKNDAPLRNFKFTKFNRTHHSLSYDITYPYPMDDKVGGGAILERWSDGGWKQMPFMPFQSNACKTNLLYFRAFNVALNTALGIKEPEKCPIPAGNYSLKDYTMDMSYFNDLKNVPFWSGRFQFTSKTKRTDTNRIFYCYIFTFNVEEKF